MTGDDWRTAWDLLNQAQDLASIDEKRAFVRRSQGSVAPHIIERVLAMLDEESESATAPSDIAAGARHGRYTVVELLGRGGMGDVYSARDTELGRLVAMKFVGERARLLPSAMDRLAREAQAASALNHPNLVTVYEVVRLDQGAGGIAIVTELVDGIPLRRFCADPQNITQVADWGAQIARGLAAAHAQSIVHGDIKPENIVLRKDGYVKVLDFGLAREAGAVPADLDELTFGTVGYMSPEQTSGNHLTGASDIFSLGVVLLELATGNHPFRDRSAAATTLAIRQSDVRISSPADAKAGDKAFAQLLREMLEKDPERRPSASQVADRLSRIAAAVPSTRRPAWIIMAAASVAAIAVGWLLFRQWNRTADPALPAPVPLTSYAGTEQYPVFSPDGTRIAFVWPGLEDENRDVWVKSIGKDDLRRVATDTWPAFTPAWSPDGSTIAYMRRAPDGSDSRILAVPADGSGPERLVATVVDHQGFVGLAWWPDSKSLIARDAGPHGRPLVRIDFATGAKQILTDGPETQDSRPTVSADGRWLGYLRTTPGKPSICVQRLAGSIQTPQCLAALPTSVDLTWLGESRAILYRQGRTLRRAEVTPDGRPANPVKLADGEFAHLSADRTGRRVAFSRNYSDANILRLDISGTPNRRAVRTFASSEEDSEPDFSPDGREILFRSRRSGNYELYIASARDGSQIRRLTNLGGHVGSARWSPDGKWIVFDGVAFTLPGQASHPAFTNLYVVAAAGGPVRMLTDDTVERMVPNWSHDGQWIYYNEEPGSHRTTWKIPFAPGGTAVRISDTEMFDIIGSSDGKWLYYTRPRLAKGLWRRAVAGGPEQLVPGTENLAYRYWQVRGDSVVFLQGRRDTGFAVLDMKTAKLRPAGPPPKQVPNGPRGMTVSPDLQTILYTEEDLTMGDILVIEFPSPL